MDLKNNYCNCNGKKCKKVKGDCNTCDWVMACTCSNRSLGKPKKGGRGNRKGGRRRR